MLLDKFPTLEKQFYENFNKINFFPKELNLYELNANNHSEVISLLGEDLKNDIPIFIKCLDEIMDNKPNNSCYIASQQLGCKTKKLNHGSSFFVHRKSTWKPWIYASWKKNDLQEKEVALEWMYKSWSKLKRFYPNIHLAQLHNHLNFFYVFLKSKILCLLYPQYLGLSVLVLQFFALLFYYHLKYQRLCLL